MNNFIQQWYFKSGQNDSKYMVIFDNHVFTVILIYIYIFIR